MGTSSPTLNHMRKGTISSKKKLTDEVRTPKKLRSRKRNVEALENQELPGPFVSGKAFVSGFYHLMLSSCFFTSDVLHDNSSILFLFFLNFCTIYFF